MHTTNQRMLSASLLEILGMMHIYTPLKQLVNDSCVLQEMVLFLH
jgi:hypothetical protein